MQDSIPSVKLDACRTGNIHHSYVDFKYSRNHMHCRFKYPFPHYTLPTNFRKEKKVAVSVSQRACFLLQPLSYLTKYKEAT